MGGDLGWESDDVRRGRGPMDSEAACGGFEAESRKGRGLVVGEEARYGHDVPLVHPPSIFEREVHMII